MTDKCKYAFWQISLYDIICITNTQDIFKMLCLASVFRRRLSEIRDFHLLLNMNFKNNIRLLHNKTTHDICINCKIKIFCLLQYVLVTGLGQAFTCSNSFGSFLFKVFAFAIWSPNALMQTVICTANNETLIYDNTIANPLNHFLLLAKLIGPTQ